MNLLRRWLVDNEMSGQTFVRRSGIPKNTAFLLINGMHRRRPFDKTLRRVAEITGIPLDMLEAEYVEPYERRMGFGTRKTEDIDAGA